MFGASFELASVMEFGFKPAPERLNVSDFNEARDDGVAVASAGPYANHLHLAPDQKPPK